VVGAHHVGVEKKIGSYTAIPRGSQKISFLFLGDKDPEEKKKSFSSEMGEELIEVSGGFRKKMKRNGQMLAILFFSPERERYNTK